MRVLAGGVRLGEFSARAGAPAIDLVAPNTAPALAISAVLAGELTVRCGDDVADDDGLRTLAELFVRRVGRGGAVLWLQRVVPPTHVDASLWRATTADDDDDDDVGGWAADASAALGCFLLLRFGPAESLPDGWAPLFDWLDDALRSGEPVSLIVAGRVGVGKSTLCRLLANRVLSVRPAVRWLDADPGQAEFLPPGVLGLHELREPVLGDALSHARQLQFEHAYFAGDSDAGRDPLAMQLQIGALYLAHASREPAPLVVNTPGWTTGLGRELLRYIVDAAPAGGRVCLVELATADGGDSLAELAGGKPHFTALTLPSVAESGAAAHGVVATLAAARRTARLLQHLTGAQAAAAAWSSVPLRRVAFERVRISALDVAPHEVLHALNGAVVGLCSDAAAYEAAASAYAVQLLPSAPVLAQCLALGLVRGIDAGRRVLYVNTSLSEAALQRVNTLVLGRIVLPAAHVGAVAGALTAKTLAPYVSFEALGADEVGAAVTARRKLARASQQARPQQQ